MTSTLCFNRIKMYGYHGVYPTEAKVGTYFFIQIKAQLLANYQVESPSLYNTINYEALYEVIKQVFFRREELIEQVALNIYNALKVDFNQVDKWLVSIEKQNPLGNGVFNPVFEISDFY